MSKPKAAKQTLTLDQVLALVHELHGRAINPEWCRPLVADINAGIRALAEAPAPAPAPAPEAVPVTPVGGEAPWGPPAPEAVPFQVDEQNPFDPFETELEEEARLEEQHRQEEAGEVS